MRTGRSSSGFRPSLRVIAGSIARREGERPGFQLLAGSGQRSAISLTLTPSPSPASGRGLADRLRPEGSARRVGVRVLPAVAADHRGGSIVEGSGGQGIVLMRVDTSERTF